MKHDLIFLLFKILFNFIHNDVFPVPPMYMLPMHIVLILNFFLFFLVPRYLSA